MPFYVCSYVQTYLSLRLVLELVLDLGLSCFVFDCVQLGLLRVMAMKHYYIIYIEWMRACKYVCDIRLNGAFVCEF